jgi:hypothetical protein
MRVDRWREDQKNAMAREIGRILQAEKGENGD